MYAPERQHAIVQRAREQGSVDVAGLADSLGVTTETVRRDLTVLERQGLLRRVHGGAIPVERLTVEPELAARDSVNAAEKERIAKAALEEIPETGSILLDAGTTTARLAEIMPADRELTVVTHFLPIAATLVMRPMIQLYLVGGRVRGTTFAAVDAWALRDLAEVTVDVAFLGTNGYSLARGFSTPDQAEAAVKQAMVSAARRVVVLADHSKHANDQFARFARLDDVDVLITDTGLSVREARRIEQKGPTVVRA
jgi:DeoR family transcriptional regulator, fructose operon transcriptional repressor